MSHRYFHLWSYFALGLPVLGLGTMIVRAELRSRAGTEFRIDILGYDPRDLLRGQYLRYQFKFNWEGESTCPPVPPKEIEASEPPNAVLAVSQPVLTKGCCLCLRKTNPGGISPFVSQVDCAEPKSRCDGWLTVEEVLPPLRYFIPEESASALQQVLREQIASVSVVVGQSGKPAVGELYLNGIPWRDALRR